MKLQQYIKNKQKELGNLQKKIDLLNAINIDVYVKGNSIFLSDYSLATHFEFKTTNDYKGGNSDYDGGVSHCIRSVYPNFYTPIKGLGKAYIENEFFGKDYFPFMKKNISNGWGDQSNESRNYDRSPKLEDFIEHYRNKGVQEKLLKKMEKEAKEVKRLSC